MDAKTRDLALLAALSLFCTGVAWIWGYVILGSVLFALGGVEALGLAENYWPDMDQLILKRTALSRPSGQWDDDDFDVLASCEVVGRPTPRRSIYVDVDSSLLASRGPLAHARL
jgi:hypothetical protein